MRRLLSGLMALLLTGCWHELGGSYVADDFPRHRITTVAVLPVINKTEQPMATAAVAAAVTRQLVNEKHYRVLPMAAVMQRLKSGGGAAAFVQLMNLLNLGQEPTPQLFHEMAVALDADALLQETVVAYHHLREDVVGATAGGPSSVALASTFFCLQPTVEIATPATSNALIPMRMSSPRDDSKTRFSSR